jgi:hypothetical protein
MTRQSHPPAFDQPNNVGWGVQIMKILILRCSNPAVSSFLDSDIFLSTVFSNTTYFRPLMRQTNFHIHMQKQEKLQFCVYQAFCFYGPISIRYFKTLHWKTQDLAQCRKCAHGHFATRWCREFKSTAMLWQSKTIYSISISCYVRFLLALFNY